MEVRITNHIINESIEFLFKLKLKGKDSRHRSRLIKRLNEHMENVSEEYKELLKQHCNLDENGEPKTTEDGDKYDIKDLDAFAKDRTDLFNEEIVIDDTNSQVMLKTVRKILSDYDGELSGREAVLYDYLCEAFKVDEDIEDTEEN